MHSLQGNVPGFHPCRSPRIIDQQQRDTLSGFHLHRSPRLIEQKQRDAHLERRRVHYTVLRDSMTEVEKEAVLKERRNAYRIWKTRNECGNTTEISEQLSITAPVRPQDHGAGTSITNPLFRGCQ
ncbi:hypothetical protein C5167_000787 [Papaver somniferum]|uniref:Uncharacterized protein n=1 Tax=Papaver somniferum TaxID=3469 RepID=A0A4Y7KXI0_PAPSO|nr:hypothetical protein C5167_000787 [Papaver somniferum]